MEGQAGIRGKDIQVKHGCGAAVVQNVVLISIPSVMDPSLAPAGKHSLHAYLPATEPFHLWEGGASVACRTPPLEAGALMLAPKL